MKKHTITIAAAVLMTAFGMGTTQAAYGANIPEVVSVPEIKTDPYVRMDGNRVFVNYLNLDGATVTLRVVDEENRVLYYERFTDAPVVEKAINFEKAYRGTYKVEVQVNQGSRSYSESLKVVR